MIVPELTPRERQVLEMTADGIVQDEIAYQLGLTVGTVAAYAKSVREKLGAVNMPNAVDLAHKCGLLGGAA